MRPHLKQPLLLLLLCVLFTIGTSYRLNPARYYRVRFARSTLTATRATLDRSFGTDSWHLMNFALDYWRETGNPRLYSELLIKNTRKYLYPPSALLIPKTLDDLKLRRDVYYDRISLLAFAVIVLASAGVALWALRRYGGIRCSWVAATWLLLLATALALTFYPIVLGMMLGQLQVWLNALFAVALLCYVRGWRGSAGVALGLMALGKPQYALFLIWGLLRREKRLLAGMLATGAVGLLVSVSVFGLAMHVDYLRGLQFLSAHGETFYWNQSVYALFGRLYGVSDPAFSATDWLWHVYPPYRPALHAATLVAGLIFVVLALLRGRAEPEVEAPVGFCQMALAATLTAPIAWIHHYGILFPTFALLWPLLWLDQRFRQARGGRVGLVVCYLFTSAFLSGLNELAPTWFNFLESYVFFAVLAIFGLLFWLRMHRTASAA